MNRAVFIDGLLVVWRFTVRLLALIGFFAVVAAFSYTAHRGVKTVRSGVCINSACDEPCGARPSRFKRHSGECVR